MQIALDGAGNTIVAGNFATTLTLGTYVLTSTGNSDVFVARMNASGEWTQAVRAGGEGDDYIYDIVVDATGNALLAGYFGVLRGGLASTTATFGTTTLTSAGNADLFVARLNAAGQWTQAVRAGGPGPDYAQSIAIDSNGSAVLTGTFDNTATFGTINLTSTGSTDVFVARLSAAGTWTQAVRAGGAAFDSSSSLALEGNGTAVIAGYFGGSAAFGTTLLTSAGNNDAFVARVDAAGNWIQVVRAGGTDGDYGGQVVLDNVGNATLTGYFRGTASFGATSLTSMGSADIFVARLNPSGEWGFAVQAGGSELDAAFGVALDGQGNVVITGFFTGTALFGSTSLTSAGGRDLVVATLNSTGSWTQAVRAGGPGDDFGTALVSKGTTVVAGLYASPATFGPTTLSSVRDGAFVAHLTNMGLATHTPRSASPFSLAPNPALTRTVLTRSPLTTGRQVVQVLDGLGRQVSWFILEQGSKTIPLDLTGLVRGLYWVRMGASVSRLVIE
ncbi:T9SS type A sorting domain-containing protein [Hymenobacter tibetensis]|uniref:T9SS type A sorting domain-containing protein n=1 Tax=Hymenobacter tibetensis TaxID=497967 RepID=A0ABY4CX12_9BACT|nr:T9SS type A sorting domain-containing protein [Hymenobacter tibetensis]UOG74552.1 T9SS type A sorting domain-containing protein [Hymenobacter tibetensis]